MRRGEEGCAEDDRQPAPGPAPKRRLKEAGLDLSTEQALQALSTIRLVSFKVGGNSARTGVSIGSARARQVLKALGIIDTKAPTPPKGEQVAV